VLELVAARARRRLRAVGEVWRAWRLVARQAEPRQLALPLYGDPGERALRDRVANGPAWPENGARLISAAMATRGDRRMAKADLHERPTYAVDRRRR
jgi:hypothetical protein